MTPWAKIKKKTVTEWRPWQCLIKAYEEMLFFLFGLNLSGYVTYHVTIAVLKPEITIIVK